MKYIVYHGTGNNFRKFNIKKTTQGLFWFTDDKEAVISKEVGAQGHGYIYKCEIEINNPCGWKEYEKLVQGQIEGMGYDGIILPDGNSNTYIVWKPEQVKILEKQKLKEAKTTKTITITASDIEDTLEELLNAIKEIGNSGHGFSIEVDREYDAEYEDGAPKFYWDGDGGDKIKDIKVETLKESFNKSKYLAWKRKNVTIRGIKDRYAENGGMAKYGQGLYTAFLSNREMARKYGTVYFVLGAIPKHPKIVNNVNDAEIFLYNVKIDWCKKNNTEFDAYDTRNFDEKTNIRDEMIALGFDGLVIKGREMVNYTPNENQIKYFQNENQLIMYYEDFIEKELQEDITLDIDKGDTIKMGKFLNKRVKVKDIGEDEHGMPLVNGKSITRVRIPKNDKTEKKVEESLVEKILREAFTYKPVKSSNLKIIGYDPVKKALQIEFLSGSSYEFSNVPPIIYNQFSKAKSKGKYFSNFIKSNYPFERLYI